MRELKTTPARETRFAALYDATYADLLRFAVRRVGPGSAEDVVAEAFLVAWRRFEDLPQGQDDARAWLFGIGRGVILNMRRGAERQRALSVRLADTSPRHGEQADDGLAARIDVARAFRRLSERHQEALALSIIDELTSPQAASVLGISPVAYRLRLSRARRALRLYLDHLPESQGRLHLAERTTDEQPA